MKPTNESVSINFHNKELEIRGVFTPAWEGVRYYPDGSGSPQNQQTLK